MGRLITFLISVFLILPVSAQTIKKCQDADGKWHYGDHAAMECEQSARVTEIDEEGDMVSETDAPPTQEELDAKLRAEEQMVEQEEAAAVQARMDQRLLVTYESADRILQTRDALLAAIDSAIDADQILRQRLIGELGKLESTKDGETGELLATPEELDSLRQQIADFDASVRDRRAKRKIAEDKYDLEHKRFQELTGN